MSLGSASEACWSLRLASKASHCLFCCSAFLDGLFEEVIFLFELLFELAHLHLLARPLLQSLVLFFDRLYLSDGRAQGLSESLHDWDGAVLRECLLRCKQATCSTSAAPNCGGPNAWKTETYTMSLSKNSLTQPTTEIHTYSMKTKYFIYTTYVLLKVLGLFFFTHRWHATTSIFNLN